MVSTILLALSLLLPNASAGLLRARAGNASCVQFMLPVTVTAQNAEYDVVKVDNNIDATAFAVNLDTHSSPSPNERLIKNITVSGTYQISSQLCVPSQGAKKSTLQIATHGLVFDKRYWDAAVQPEQYSYVQAAMKAGYSILTYDRLGTGMSSKPDAYTVVQAPLELEILRRITEMARTGDLWRCAQKGNQSASMWHGSGSGDVAFRKIIHVGHSFGSFLTSALLASYGNISDGAVITGYVLNKYFSALHWTSLGAQYAPQNDPQLFGDRGSGYLVPGTVSDVQTGFFSTRQNTTTGIGGFDPKILDYAYSIRQTITTSEIVSPSQLNLGVAEGFKGPVQFVLGEFDFLVCEGDCQNTYDPAMIKSLYPKASDVDFYIQPGTGHGLTLHYKAGVGYQATFTWLAQNGL